MSETTTTDTTVEGDQQEQQERTYSQADVDKIVRDRLTQQAKNRFGDYDDLKAKAEGARTVEEQLADLQRKHTETEARALRSDIAARHGVSPEDRDLFLTGSDEATLTAQAERLAARDAEIKKKGNVAPKEGASPRGTAENESLTFVNDLFGGSDTD